MNMTIVTTLLLEILPSRLNNQNSLILPLDLIFCFLFPLDSLKLAQSLSGSVALMPKYSILAKA